MIVGQTPDVIKNAENILIKDGAKLILEYMISKVPWLGIGLMNPIVGFFAKLAVKFIIENLDRAAFAIFVSIKVKKQVSDYIVAQDSGSQSEIDNAADDLIKLGKI